MSEGSFEPMDIYRFYIGVHMRVCTYKKENGYWAVRVTKENSGEILLDISKDKEGEPFFRGAAVSLAEEIMNKPYNFLACEVRNKS